MSKVKNLTENSREKEKLRYRLRRKEEQHLKEKRMTAAREKQYRYLRGYCVKEERLCGSYMTVTIPAQDIIDRRVREWRRIPVVYEEGGEVFQTTTLKPVYEVVKRHYPERTVKRSTGRYYEPVKPYLKRSHITKRYYKHYAAKRARKLDLQNGNAYKKAYDIEWELW